MISPLSISKAKLVESLKRKKNRVKYNQFVIEGEKIVKTAIGLDCPILFIISTHDEIFEDSIAQYKVDGKTMKKLTALQTPSNTMAVIDKRAVTIKDKSEISCTKPIMYLEHIQDPGNLGTIIRTCDWFDFALAMSPDCVDVFNPKVIQSSMGAIFTANMAFVTLDSLTQLAHENEMKIYTMDMNGSSLAKHDETQRAIYIFGNEGQGISKEANQVANGSISIPGQSNAGADSLNVAVSLAVLCGRLI